MSDKEQTLAALCQTGILSVKAPPASKIPALPYRAEEGCEITVFVKVQVASRLNLTCLRTAPVGQEAGDILENQPAGPKSLSQRKELKGQVAARRIHAETLSGDREVLAGGSGNEKVDWLIIAFLDGREVAM